MRRFGRLWWLLALGGCDRTPVKSVAPVTNRPVTHRVHTEGDVNTNSGLLDVREYPNANTRVLRSPMVSTCSGRSATTAIPSAVKPRADAAIYSSLRSHPLGPGTLNLGVLFSSQRQ